MTVEDWLGKENKLGIDIWKKKYQYKNESFDIWLDRVSGQDEKVKQLIIDKKFLFAGRILSNRGVPTEEVKTTYSNCYVIAPPEDNLESIYDTCKKLARTYSYGGGCGIDISKLAPEGAKVRNQAKCTSGAVSFMNSFAQVTEQIGQHGRRGALMISLRCDHPDIEKFITIKSDLNKVNYANISVMVTDDFMKAVEEDKNWELKFERPETNEKISKKVKAKDLFRLLCEQNWNYAEPGILFWDTIERENLLNTNPEFHYAGTNPCAEEPLPEYGSCSLSSLNLAAFVNGDKTFNFDSFKEAIEIAVRAQNDVLDEGLEKHPLEEQRECVRDWRQIGIGIMGLADCLIKMGLTYGKKEAIEFCDKLGNFLATNALIESSNVALQKGWYPKFTYNVLESEFYKRHETKDNVIGNLICKQGLRNSQILTIAPTGTISTMLGISGGIEPIFANSYTRRTQSLYGKDVEYKVYTPVVEQYMKANNITDEKDLPEYFVTASDLTVDERIAMQGTWQKHIDASISSTVNLPESATIEDVEQIYMNAWKNGLKGITVFRAGCKRDAILSTPTTKKEDKKEDKPQVQTDDTGLARGEIIECSNNLIGLKRKLTTGCGSLHVQCFFDPDSRALHEVYVSKGSTGGCNVSLTSISRLISMSCRAGVAVPNIIDQLQSAGPCVSYTNRKVTKGDTSKGSSCSSAIGYAILDMQKEFKSMQKMNEKNAAFVEKVKIKEQKEKTKKEKEEQEYIDKGLCPICHEPLIKEGGCVICKNDGFSICG